MKTITKLLALALLFAISTNLSAQTVQNSNHATTAYVNDGTVYNSNHATIGYIRNDGTVQNSSHATIGYIRNDGTVQNSSHATVGYAKGIEQKHTAALLFFFGLLR